VPFSILLLARVLSFPEDQSAEVFRDVVGIAIGNARGLPAHEAALCIGAFDHMHTLVDDGLPLGGKSL
jgi:hypothetical protein